MNIQERMNHFNVPGVGVTYFEQTAIKWSKYFGILEQGTQNAVNKNSIFHACSISKMVTALCILRLAQEGALDLAQDVNNYLTSWKIPSNEFTLQKKITLMSLLSHQAGFHDPEGSFSPYKRDDKIPSTLDLLKGTTHYNPEEVEAKYRPGTDCHYSDAGYAVLAQIAYDVTGMTISEVAQGYIFQPLNLQQTFFWPIGIPLPKHINSSNLAVGHNKNGEIVDGKRAIYPNEAGAGLWTTTEELTHIVIDIIKAYQGMDSTVLNQKMAKLMLTPFGCTDDVGLGVFLAVDKKGEPCFLSQGWGVGMQCKLDAYYENQSGVIVMTNSDPGIYQDEALVGEIIKYVCEHRNL